MITNWFRQCNCGALLPMDDFCVSCAMGIKYNIPAPYQELDAQVFSKALGLNTQRAVVPDDDVEIDQSQFDLALKRFGRKA